MSASARLRRLYADTTANPGRYKVMRMEDYDKLVRERQYDDRYVVYRTANSVPNYWLGPAKGGEFDCVHREQATWFSRKNAMEIAERWARGNPEHRYYVGRILECGSDVLVPHKPFRFRAAIRFRRSYESAFDIAWVRTPTAPFWTHGNSDMAYVFEALDEDHAQRMVENMNQARRANAGRGGKMYSGLLYVEPVEDEPKPEASNGVEPQKPSVPHGGDGEQVGDVTSDRIGSGARFNSGKPRIDLLDLLIVAQHFQDDPNVDQQDVCALMALENFRQLGGKEPRALDNAIRSLIQQDPEGMLTDTARVLEHGARKYAPGNWAKGMPWSVVFGCAARHAVQQLCADSDRRDDLDDGEGGSGLPHRTHMLCNLIFLKHYATHYPQGNDFEEAYGIMARRGDAS